jgi:hypothetical protein
MRARFFIFKAALVLLVSVSGAWPQSYDAAPTQNKGIDPALLSKAQAGDPNAEFDVAYDYQTGQGSPQDLTKAAFWFRKAGDHGHARAQYSLALLYNTGQGVPQDYAEGYFWAELAATGKVEGVRSEVVAKLRDQTASFLTKEVLLQTQERARAWFAAHQFGIATANGSSTGTPKDADTSPASSPMQNAPAQEWVKAETDQIRAMVQAIKLCPASVNESAASTIVDGPPYNVTWDVRPSDSVRAPYSGYIEFVVQSTIQCSPERRRSSPMGCATIERPQVPLVLRYEYDFSPDGLNIERIRARRDNESTWIDYAAMGRYCWLKAAQPREKVLADDATRVALFSHECSSGDLQGCVNLGTMYRMGWGVGKDLSRASDLFKKACAGGNRDGCKSLELIQPH